MRSLAIVLGGAMLLAACGGAAAPTASSSVAAATSAAPSPTPAKTSAAPSPTQAATLKFTADLKTENEVPPIANDEKSGSGKATVTFDLTRDASGKAMSAKVSIQATLSGFPASAAITLAHIHGPAAAGASAGVQIPFKTDADNPLTLTGGGTTFTKENVVFDKADVLQQLLDDPSKFYVNFHSKINPGGVVRGQLTKS